MTTEQEKTRLAKVQQNLIDLLGEEGHNYQLDYWPEILKPEQSGTADLHLVEWGPHRVKRVAKSNKPAELLTSPRQKRHVIERGYDTRNELQIAAAIDHPGVLKVVDYFDAETSKEYGFNGPVLVQEYLPDSESLEEIVIERRAVGSGVLERLGRGIYNALTSSSIKETLTGKRRILKRTQIALCKAKRKLGKIVDEIPSQAYELVTGKKKVISRTGKMISRGRKAVGDFLVGNESDRFIYEIALQTTRTLRDLHNGVGTIDGKGIVHRDLKPSNILVQRKKGNLVARLVDCGNAGYVDSQKPGYLPTMGGHVVSDPLRMGVFTGEERKYETSSDVYGLMSSLLFLARGKPAVEYNPDTGEARAVDSWESLLNDSGRLDKEKHRVAIRKAVRALPKNLRAIAERALSLNESERYDSTEEFLGDLEKAIANTTYSRLKKFTIGITATGLVLGGLIGYSHFHDVQKGLTKKVQEAQKDALLKKKYKAIDLWQQRRTYTNLAKDPENKNMIFFSEDSNDGFESAELRGWMDLFYHWNFEDNRYYGDPKTAFAAYLDSAFDKYPDVVLEAVMKVNNIKNQAEAVRRLKSYDKTLKLDYNSIDEEIKKIDEGLYYRLFSINSGGSDMISRIIESDHYQGTRVQLECAGEIYELKQQRQVEIAESRKKAEQDMKNPSSSGIVGDAYKLRLEGWERRELDRIDKDYEEKMQKIRKSHFH